VYEGFRGTTNLFRQMLDELKRGDEYKVVGAGYGDIPGLREFFRNHHRMRVEKGVWLKMLANHETRDNIEPLTKVRSKVRFLPKFFLTNMTIVFYKDKSFIMIRKNPPIGFLIYGSDVVRGFNDYFDTLWKIAKP
jgi:hypothetical protein